MASEMTCRCFTLLQGWLLCLGPESMVLGFMLRGAWNFLRARKRDRAQFEAYLRGLTAPIELQEEE